MASREDEKKRARQEREARAQEEATADRRKRRLTMLSIALAGAVVVVVAAILISSSGGSGSKGGGAQAGPVVGAAEVNARWSGIPQTGFAAGDPKAPVTLVEFADLQCPFCKASAVNTLPTLVQSEVKPGKLRMEFRNFAILGPDSEKAARAVAEAANQNKAWQFIELWYLNQGEENTGYVTDAFIQRIASAVTGLDAAKVVAASNDASNTSSIDAARADAQKYGVDSTPSYLVGRTGGQLQQLQLDNPSDPAQFTQVIDKLAQQGG
jgi:protein-disulfide isomerase